MTTHPANSITHTPGPWGIAADGAVISQTTGKEIHWPRDASKEDGANARLIAASPELYEFAAMIARMTQDGEEVDGEEFVLENDDAVDTVNDFHQARALAAKARGDA
jgi:hypothetical protein